MVLLFFVFLLVGNPLEDPTGAPHNLSGYAALQTFPANTAVERGMPGMGGWVLGPDYPLKPLVLPALFGASQNHLSVVRLGDMTGFTF